MKGALCGLSFSHEKTKQNEREREREREKQFDLNEKRAAIQDSSRLSSSLIYESQHTGNAHSKVITTSQHTTQETRPPSSFIITRVIHKVLLV